MKISGFTMVRNAEKFYFPIKESIQSVLPIVDEFIVALGDNDKSDHTRELIESIGSDKIKIFDRVWDKKKFMNSEIFALETNFALQQCTGDWCFYIQADEVVHEKDLPRIKNACEKYLDDKNIDALLFNYLHFWGDYDHYLPFHGWYKNEMRVVRNNCNVYSIKDAQSFRKGNYEKLNVKPIGAEIFHYGWVRPPHLMQSKKKEHDSIHHSYEKVKHLYELKPNEYDYGPLGRIPVYRGSHPKVMEEYIKKLDWKKKLNYSRKKVKMDRPLNKHEKIKYRILSFFENTFNGGRYILGGYSNWNKV